MAGASGSGKTRLAARIGDVLQIPHIELHSLHWGPHWTPRAEFEVDVGHLAHRPAWVTEWQYAKVRPLLLRRSDLMVWLDYPRRVSMKRMLRRSVGRYICKTELWNGNREPNPFLDLLANPENILRWSFTGVARYRRDIEAVLRSDPGYPGYPGYPVVRLTAPGDTQLRVMSRNRQGAQGKNSGLVIHNQRFLLTSVAVFDRICVWQLDRMTRRWGLGKYQDP